MSSDNGQKFVVDQEKLNRILKLKEELGDKFPKFGVFVISYNASQFIAKTIARIPKELFDCIEEVYIFDDSSPDNTYDVAKQLKEESFWKTKLNAYKNPKNLGYGGNQKNGYRYAIAKELDYVIMLHGDGQYAPEFIPDLMLPAIEQGKEVVFGSRMVNKMDALRGGMPFYKWIGNQVLTKFENFILGTKLAEFHSGYRMYSTNVLRHIPFEENANEFHFDTQIIIQCRALDVEMYEVPIKTHYGDEECNVNGLKYAKDICLDVLVYRLHQLHLLRRSRYLVKREAQYTRKYSPYSSHEQILKLLDKPGKVLNLGAGRGLFEEAFKEKQLDYICVDKKDPTDLTIPAEKYIQLDLQDYKKLDFKREFDYIILSDTVEHLVDAESMLKYIHRFLKPDGKIIVSTPNIAIWFYRLSLLIGRFNYGDKGILDETHVKLYTLSTITQLLERSGYVINKTRASSLPFEVVFESIGKNFFLKLADRLYYLFAKCWKRLFAYQFIVEAEISTFITEEGEGKIEL